MVVKPTNAHKCMKVYYKHSAPLHVYNKLSYTYVHLLVLLPYLTAQCTVMDHLKSSWYSHLEENVIHW
jgi:hypothetical protein